MREPLTEHVYKEDGVFWWRDGSASYAAGEWDARIMGELARELLEERAKAEKGIANPVTETLQSIQHTADE